VEKWELPPPFYEDLEGYKMAPKRKYLTVDDFSDFKSNDFRHLQMKVKLNTRLLWLILTALLGSAAIERIFG